MFQGAEVAWDLDYKGSSSDKDFIYNYLKSKYINDAPNGQSGIFYQAEPVINSIFDGVGTISYDNGTHGTFNVKYPDVIAGLNGGIECLQYSNLSNQFAAIYFQGIFPGGNENGKLVFVGFPFETIYPESTRNIFLSKIISFFNAPVSVSDNFNSVPESFLLFQNYPNPFNPSTIIQYAISSLPTGQAGRQLVTLKVYDILGNEVATLVNEYRNAGSYEVNFDASRLASGVYYYQLKAGEFVETNKMILLK